jgi:hypothetical protein
MLLMTDEQKMAFERELATRVAVAPPAVQVTAALPPPPEIGQPVPPPVVIYTPRPPDFGGLQLQDFEMLPPPPPPGQIAAAVVVEQNNPVRERAVRLAVELGDNLFRRGKYREAHTQFELALSLSPHHSEVSLRIERCRPHLPPPPPPPVIVAAPPPPVVVIDPAPPPPVVVPVVPVVRPRIAVMNFVVNAQPGLVPPALGDWAAEQVACYYAPTYEVVERGEVCWYMGRLGVTMKEVLAEPSARCCLARALNVRLFVFGAIQQTASFDVTTHLVDAETGARQGGGKVHVQDQQELKLRMGELVRQTQSNPADQNRLQQEAKETERILNEARQHYQAGRSAQAIAVCQDGLKRFPNHAGLRALLQQAEEQARQADLEKKRRQEIEAQKAQALALQQKQKELAREAEAARLRAQQSAAARNEEERRAQEAQKQRAYDELFAGGERALQQGDYAQAIQKLQSATALKPTVAGLRELAAARAKLDEAARKKAAEEQARREAEVRHQKEAELAKVQAKVAEEQRKRAAEEQARRQAQEARDQAAYAKLMDDGRRLLGQNNFEGAAASFQSARQLRQTAEVNQLLAQVSEKKTLAAAQSAKAKADLERKLAEEKAARERADVQAKRNQELYTQALQAAQKALAEKRYDEAVVKYQEAGKFFRTDAVLNGIRAAEDGRKRDQAAAEAANRKGIEDQRKAAELQRLAAEKAKQDAAAAAAAAQARQRAEAEARKKKEDEQKVAQVNQLLVAGRAALNAKQFDAAAKAFTEASKLAPASPDVVKALQDLGQARKTAAGAAAAAAAEARKKQIEEQNRKAEFSRLMNAGKAAMTAKKYDEAVKTYTAALKLQPGDSAATAALKEANQALQGSKPAPAPPPKK